MTEHDRSSSPAHALMTFASLVIIAWGVNQAQAVLSPMLVAVFLSILGTRPVLWLEERNIPSVLAVLLVVFGMIAILLITGGLVATSLNGFIDALPSYQQRIVERMSSLRELLSRSGMQITDKALLGSVKPDAIMNLAVGMLAGVGAALSNVVLILLTVTFILLEASSFPMKIRAVFEQPHKIFPRFERFVGDIQRYMLIKTFISLTTGILIGIWLSILGVDFPLLWGFLVFLLNYVPNVGSIIASIPPILLALVQLGTVSAALTASGFLVITFLLGNAVEPRLMGRRLGLSTLVIFLSLVFWGSLLGPIGMLLSIPFTMMLKFVCENNSGTQWIAVMLGSAAGQSEQT